MISDEELIASLIQTKTIREAADACGLGESAVYARLRDSAFKERYNKARIEMLEEVKNRLQAEMGASVGVLSSIRDNENNSAQVRINASDCLLRHSYKLTEQLDLVVRIEALENAIEGGVGNES